MLLKVSTVFNRPFKMISSADHLSKVTGAAPVVTISKNNGAFGAAAGTVTENANGWYNVALTTADTNTKGALTFYITGTGADDCDFADQVLTDLPGDTVASVTGAVGSVTAGVTVTTNNDKTGYSLTQTFPTNFSSLAITAGGAVTVGTNSDKTGYSLTVTPPTAAQIATGVWQDATAGDFTVVSSIGKSLYTSGNAPGAASGIALVGSNMGTVSSVTGNVAGSVGSVTARVTANTDQINGTAQTARDLGLALPAAAPGAAGGVFIAGTNAPVTITGSGDALTLSSSAANGRGLVVAGNGTGSGATVTGGATGPGLKLVGGGTSGDGVDITTTSGDGISILPTAGSAIVATGNGTSKFGIIATGGTAGTSDGVKAVAGTGGVPIRGDLTGNITGNITGNLSGSVAAVSGAVGSVTGGVGGSVAGSVASVTAGVTLAAGAVTSTALATSGTNAIADGVLDRDMSTGTDSGSPTVRTVRQALRVLRNKVDIPGGTVYKEDDTTASWTFGTTTAAGNPVTVVDPA